MNLAIIFLILFLFFYQYYQNRENMEENIPTHTHGIDQTEKKKIIKDIKTQISSIKQNLNHHNNLSKLTPAQYQLWKQAIDSSLKVPKKVGKQPQPINIDVDTIDNREVYYDMPGGTKQAVHLRTGLPTNTTSVMKKLLNEMELNPATRKTVEDALDKYKPAKSKQTYFDAVNDARGNNYAQQSGSRSTREP